jgi:hypothetical protein
MAEGMEDKQLFELLFIELVYSFQNMAMIAMGKLVNPATNKTDRNMPQAKATIDMIRMLKEKTANNLTENETKLIEQVVLNLQLNYADEIEKDKKEGKT